MKYRLLNILVLLFFVGCVQDPALEPNAPIEEHLFTLSVEPFSDEMVAATRSAAGSTTINRGFIFFYSASGVYKGYENTDDLNLKQSGSTVSFDVPSKYSIKDKLIGIFNHDAAAVLPSDFSAVTAKNIDTFFPISRDYLSAVEAEMNSGSCNLGLPMYLNDFTDSDRAVREVYRSVARMEIFIKEGLEIEHDSHTHPVDPGDLTFAVVNSVSVGSVGAASSPNYTVEACFDVDNFDGVFPHHLTMYTTAATDTNNKVYLHPYTYSKNAVNGNKLGADTFDAERFAVVMKHNDINISTGLPVGEPRYYKLNLLDKLTSTYFDVERNHSYRVVIKAVNSRGYATLKEAYEMPPSNIEYEIYDDKGGLTYSNGQYAISMDEILSYDEVLVYSAKETILEFNNIRYVLPDGGQMDDAEFDTNEVIFKTLSDDKGLIIDTQSDFNFGKDGKSKLTADGKSIRVTLSGEGECSIALRIRLGNLEMGRDDITIKKVATNGNGDGSFDAHPNHEEIKGQIYVEGSWQSDDIDFGARASSSAYGESDGGTVIYMGENATPTGYRTMDGNVSGQYSVNSYPVFSPKTRRGYYSYIDSKGKTRKVMIQLDQLAPFYLGHFGRAATEGSIYHYNGLICEKIEEIAGETWEGPQKINGVMIWSEGMETYYKGTIWGDPQGFGSERYQNLVDGLEITKNIVETNTSVDKPVAAEYCYMKNDVNGDGVIGPDEPVVWYLPAQNQALAMWINMNVFDEDDGLYNLNNNDDGDSRTYYWTCSEVAEMYDYTWSKPTSFSTHVWAFNMLEGQSDYLKKLPTPITDVSSQCHIRCVRGLPQQSITH